MGYENGEGDQTRKPREGGHDSGAASSQWETCFREMDDCYTLHRLLESVSTLLTNKAKRGEKISTRLHPTPHEPYASVYGISDWD